MCQRAAGRSLLRYQAKGRDKRDQSPAGPNPAAVKALGRDFRSRPWPSRSRAGLQIPPDPEATFLPSPGEARELAELSLAQHFHSTHTAPRYASRAGCSCIQAASAVQTTPRKL
jgi:hypothetical protein